MNGPENEERIAQPAMSFLGRLGGIFVSPRRVFADVDRGSPWWEPWAWCSLVYMAAAYISLPVQLRLFELTRNEMPPEEFERSLAWAQTPVAKALAIGAWPVGVLFEGVVFAAVSYLAVSALSEFSSFRKHLTICLWSSVASSLGVLLSNIVVRLRGIEEVRGFRDAIAPFGPAVLLSDDGGRIWYALLSTLDVFSIWFYGLMAVGVIHVFRMSGRATVLVIVPIWLVSILIALIVRSGGPS
jgi:hypothetical protein